MRLAILGTCITLLAALTMAAAVTAALTGSSTALLAGFVLLNAAADLLNRSTDHDSD